MRSKAVFWALSISLLLCQFIQISTAGDLNTQLQFDGDDDALTLPNNPSMDLIGVPSFTWEAWIYPTGWGGNGYGRILDIFNINTHTIFWIGTDGFLAAQFGYNASNSAYAVSGTGYVDLNQWNHVIATHENRNFTLYIDTVEPSYDQYAEGGGEGNHLSSGSEDWYIGNRVYEDRGFQGNIDEFRYYDRVINSTEILYSFNNIEPLNQTGMIAWLRMNEGSGSTAFDETANDNDFALYPDYPTNSPIWTVQAAQTVSNYLNDAAGLVALLLALLVIVNIIYIIAAGGSVDLIKQIIFSMIVLTFLLLIVATWFVRM